MNRPLYPCKSRAIQTLALSLAVLGLATGLALVACKPPEINDSTGPVDTTTTTGTATLQLSNRIAQDPGTISFFLFPKNSVDFTNAAGAKLIGSVEAGATKAIQIPAGSWKLAYEDKARVLFPMRDESSGGLEWLRSDFKKDGNYSVILSSDGNRTIWVPSYTTVPPMSPI
jgi:hypothetical protein